MEQLIINVGSSPDSNTGDTINEAFNKVNDNFTFLFSKYDLATNFNSSYISLTPPSDEIINGVTDFGLLINLPNSTYITMMYDSALPRLDPVTNSIKYGAFRVQDNTGNLSGIYTNSISTYNNQNLNLLSKGTGIVSVTGTVNYERQVFYYDNNGIDLTKINDPKDPDALINAQAMIDYVNAYNFTNTEDRIVATGDPTTYVATFNDTSKRATIVVDNLQVAEFTTSSSQINKILINDNRISAVGMGNDLILDTELDGNIDVSDNRITNLASPIDAGDAVNLTYLNNITSTIGNLGDVDLTNIADGSLLVYNLTNEKFEATNNIDAGIY